MNMAQPFQMLRRARNRVRLATASPAPDAFLVSYPKSGRTWFRFLLSNYFSLALGLRPSVDLHSMFTVLPNFDRDPERGLAAFGFADRAELPLIAVSHLGYNRFLFRSRPLIMMVRDPRDVLVSAYFHATRHKHRFSGSIDEFLVDREQGVPPLARYLNGWAEAEVRSRLHVLTYEKLTSDTASEAAAVLRFLGCEVDHATLDAAVSLSRFDAMRNRERDEGLPAHDYDRSDNESLRMRRGKAGGYADYLEPAQIVTIERLCAQMLSPAAKRMVATTGLVLP